MWWAKPFDKQTGEPAGLPSATVPRMSFLALSSIRSPFSAPRSSDPPLPPAPPAPAAAPPPPGPRPRAQ
eukprot:2116365-Pyramimonas_sp.AAC.1